MAGKADISHGAKLHQSGKLDEAESIYRGLLADDPRHFDANHLLGVIYLQRGDAQKAAEQIKFALSIVPDSYAAHSNLGNALYELRRFGDALAAYDRAIARKPDFVDAIVNRGNTLKELRRIPEALAGYDRAIALQPNRADAYLNRATALKNAKRYTEALADFDRAIALKPAYPEAYNNRATLLKEMQRPAEALESYEKAIALRPEMADAHVNRGNLLKDLKRLGDALDSYGRALPLKRGNTFLEGLHLHTKMLMSDWRDYAALTAGLRDKVNNSQLSTTPFALLALPSSAGEQLKCAASYAAFQHPPLPPEWKGEKYTHDKIRIGYFSADYHEHATAFLMAGLFERHDRQRFHITGFSFGRDDGSPMRKRLVAAFDEFIDVSRMGDEQVSKLARQKEIDIAIDLKGYTQEARADLFARRCAPLQVNYIGYPGTMGAPYMDYIIADKVVIPDGEQRFYTEKTVRLPGTYQVTDSTRAVANNVPSRKELGLPETGFVFCSFNNNYKITPDVFDVWMRLLRAVDGSVLWLLEDNPGAAVNLRREAVARGVQEDRLVFAPKMLQEHHLARHRQADLFLDTLPYNAHTTASDALWAGLPVVTCMGQTFASRVAGSLLLAAGLPELLSHSLADYENLALALARDPQRLSAIKNKLAANRDSCALFDTARYTRNLESAYQTMWQRHQDGLPAQGFDVADAA